MRNAVFQYYKSMINSDSTDGRGHTVCIGRYENEQQAYEHIKGKGIMVSLGLILLILGLCGIGGQTLVWIGGVLILVGLVLNLAPINGNTHRVW